MLDVGALDKSRQRDKDQQRKRNRKASQEIQSFASIDPPRLNSFHSQFPPSFRCFHRVSSIPTGAKWMLSTQSSNQHVSFMCSMSKGADDSSPESRDVLRVLRIFGLGKPGTSGGSEGPGSTWESVVLHLYSGVLLKHPKGANKVPLLF